MALGNFLDSYMNPIPQENQYLKGNPFTDTSAQTDWMNPENSTPNSGFSGAGSSGGAAPAMSIQSNGTALSSIANGNTSVGQYVPEGYDTGKLNDPANANSLKYQVGRILSNYPPGPEGLQAAAAQLRALGISVVGKDTIRLPDGTTADVGRAFGDPNASHAWQYNWSGPLGSGNNSMQPSSYMSNSQNGQNGQSYQMYINQMMQQLFGQQQGRRDMFRNQQQNPTGGFVPPTGGFTGYGGGNNPNPGTPIPQPQIQPFQFDRYLS